MRRWLSHWIADTKRAATSAITRPDTPPSDRSCVDPRSAHSCAHTRQRRLRSRSISAAARAGEIGAELALSRRYESTRAARSRTPTGAHHGEPRIRGHAARNLDVAGLSAHRVAAGDHRWRLWAGCVRNLEPLVPDTPDRSRCHPAAVPYDSRRVGGSHGRGVRGPIRTGDEPPVRHLVDRTLVSARLRVRWSIDVCRDGAGTALQAAARGLRGLVHLHRAWTGRVHPLHFSAAETIAQSRNDGGDYDGGRKRPIGGGHAELLDRRNASLLLPGVVHGRSADDSRCVRYLAARDPSIRGRTERRCPMKVFITGGSGVIGRRAIPILR